MCIPVCGHKRAEHVTQNTLKFGLVLRLKVVVYNADRVKNDVKGRMDFIFNSALILPMSHLLTVEGNCVKKKFFVQKDT